MTTSVHAVVGLRWLDTRTGEEYEIARITPDNIGFSHTPGQGVISGGSHCKEAWQKSVERGEYVIQHNTKAEGAALRGIPWTLLLAVWMEV